MLFLFLSITKIVGTGLNRRNMCSEQNMKNSTFLSHINVGFKGDIMKCAC